MKIIPLSEGSFTIDKSKKFIPFDEEQDRLTDRPAGSLLVEVQPFVLITEKDVLLLDAGLGFTNRDGLLQIHQNLLNNNIDPKSVTKVLMTHLHKDHAGGVSKEDKVLGHSFLSFPNATYYIQQRELKFAFDKGSPSFIPQELQALWGASNVVTLSDDEGLIDNYIAYRLTGAHSPYHQVFWIREGNETIFFGGDDAPQLQQMRTRFVAKYDFDGKKCMELRQQWWEQGEKEGWTFLFYHDIKTPIYTNRGE